MTFPPFRAGLAGFARGAMFDRFPRKIARAARAAAGALACACLALSACATGPETRPPDSEAHRDPRPAPVRRPPAQAHPPSPPPPPPMTTRERIEKGGPSPATYFPLAVGNEWTYAVTTAGQTQQETIHIVGRDGPWYLDDQRGRLRIEADGVRDGDRYLLRAPLVAGSTWTAVDNLVVQQFELAAVDVTLVTPSGKFEHCVVVRNDQPLPNGARFVTEWTYAPAVGLVALRTFTSAQGREKTQTSLTLVSYRLENR